MKTYVVTATEWHGKIMPKLVASHGPAIRISYVIKRELGFTPRFHNLWSEPKKSYLHEMHLDFYDEESYTAFILTYT